MHKLSLNRYGKIYLARNQRFENQLVCVIPSVLRGCLSIGAELDPSCWDSVRPGEKLGDPKVGIFAIFGAICASGGLGNNGGEVLCNVGTISTVGGLDSNGGVEIFCSDGSIW